MYKDALISECNNYRYVLYRYFDKLSKNATLFIMLNPSVADDKVDDPTIRRCINYSKLFGSDGLIVVNLFAYRATNPKKLKEVNDPIGPSNLDVIKYAINFVNGPIVCAWGANGVLNNQNRVVYNLIIDNKLTPMCLNYTKKGEPVHPLYQPKNIELKEFIYDRNT